MEIPKLKNYPKGEYSLVQITPTLDSQELINIGIIVKNIDENNVQVRLFDDMKKLSSRIYIENLDSLEYTLAMLRKKIEKYNDHFSYQNFTNSLKINSPIPISITESTIDLQLEKLYKEKITLLKTFPEDSFNRVNNVYDKSHIITNLNVMIRSKQLDDVIKTRKQMRTKLGSSKQVDAIAYNANGNPIIVSDILSPTAPHLDELYAKSLFILKSLVDTTIQEKMFYIPSVPNLDTDTIRQLQYIKEDMVNEGIRLNDSIDPQEFIEELEEAVQNSA